MNDDAVKENKTNEDIRRDIVLYRLEKDVDVMKARLSLLTDRISALEEDDVVAEYNVSRIAAWGSFALAGLGTLFFIMAAMTVVAAIV